MDDNLQHEAWAAARRFRTERALDTARALWEKARGMDSAAVQAVAERAACELREAGLADADIELLPADGTSSYGGWVMPVEWVVRDARMEMAGARGAEGVLADFAAVPQSLALYSPETPGGRWVEGPVVSGRGVDDARGRLRGRFLFLTEGMGSFEINEAAARAGALGVIVCVPNADDRAARYLNYAVPLDARRRCVPCFSLAPGAGERLKARLAADAGLRLRARVRARRRAGTFPLVTATLGEGNPPVYVCAHLDEPGAQDNASGVAVAIEALRTLRTLEGRRDFCRPRRALRILLSTEVRGLQAWLNRAARPPVFLAGINVDMAGCAAADPASAVVLREGFRDQGHFARYLLHDAGRIADSVAPGVETKTGFNYVSDAILMSCRAVGHVSVEQTPGPTYHTSADMPAILSKRTLRWSGAATVAFLYAATRLDPADGLRLARRIVRTRSRELVRPSPKAVIVGWRMREELESLRGVVTVSMPHRDWSDPEQWYRAGVRRGSGCWPEVEQRERLERLIADARLLSAAPGPGRPASAARREAGRLVPLALFNGFLSFEDQTRPEQAATLQRELGLRPRWGTENWAWMLARRMRGKETLAGVVDSLVEEGVEVDMGAAVRLTQRLVRDGKARLRPVIDADVLQTRLRALGVSRGRILVTHSSLSAFGHIPGGAATVVDVLLQLLGPRGTLVMPTHTNSVLGEPPYDRSRSPSKVGAISEYFRTLPGVVRSPHPTHSVAAYGPAAEALTGAHRPDMSPLARDGFWGRLYDMDGEVLLLCPIRSATVFHAGEDWTGVPQPVLVAHSLGAGGRRRIHILPHGPWHVDHFEESLARPLLRRRLMTRAKLGEGLIYLARARDMADISVEANRANPMVSLGKGGRCTCFYCQTLRRGGLAETG